MTCLWGVFESGWRAASPLPYPLLLISLQKNSIKVWSSFLVLNSPFWKGHIIMPMGITWPFKTLERNSEHNQKILSTCSDEPSNDILGLLDRYGYPWKKTKKNMHLWSFFWQKKIQNSTFLQIGAWNFYGRVLWYVESDGVILIKVLWLIGDVSPFFQKKANLLRCVTFDGYN
jgi:hypothetical protein